MTAFADSHEHVPRAIEVGFPIAEINRLAQPERNSFKPIYQMHKWFARRASCVFRAILLGALKPAWDADGETIDLMEEFYRNHGDDPDTVGKVVLDPFMGGGTTVVEALRLGCRVIGIDLNPVAWFIVKTEVEPADLDALRDAFERLAARPVAWNRGAPLRETLHELRQEMFQLPGHGIRVVGLEAVLRAGEDPPRDVANFIHATMAAKANELESRGGFVQVVFKFKLRYAADLWFEAGLQRISLVPVFGQVRPVHERGSEYYIASFNLA